MTKEISIDREKVIDLLKWCSLELDRIFDERPYVAHTAPYIVRISSVIEVLLILLQHKSATELNKQKDIEFEYRSIFFRKKKATRKESRVETMRREAKEYFLNNNIDIGE